jgi:fumarate hydratase class II
MPRIEHDSLGEVEVPDGALWKAQTQRAVENFAISGERVDPAIVRALVLLKHAAARANAGLGVLDTTLAARICDAADRLVAGEHADQFPVDVFQTGSGTSTNMNVNEVLATLSGAHPNDEVNASQSSNDVFPSALHLAAATLVVDDLLPALDHLAQSLERQAARHVDSVKAGRTHLMDATPITFGQELGGWAAQVRYGGERLRSVLPRVCELPLGGTAVGTGLNAPAGFASAVVADLATRTGLPLTEARNHVEAQGARDSLVELSGVLRTIAVGLYKIANDLRLLSSGPRTGLAEVHLPDLQPGSSIMPGKVNPVVPEAVCQVVAQVIGNDAAIAFGGAAGTLELNVMLPVIGRNLVSSPSGASTGSRRTSIACAATPSPHRASRPRSTATWATTRWPPS